MNQMHLLKLFFLLNLIVLFTQIDGQITCLEEERIGLLELKSFLKLEGNGSGHLLPSWVDDPRSDCCAWERVTCNSTNGRVVELSLSNIGVCSSSYWNITLFQSFKELKTLNLSYNCISWKEIQGSKGLLRLQQLETLDLTFNRLISSNLDSLRKLKSLKNLILRYNSLNGSFPARELSVFENLETLDLSFNKLSGDSPTKFDSESFSKLRDVMLSENSFSVDIMRFLGSLPSLRSLNLSLNGMEGVLSSQDLITLGRLEVLDLSYNQLVGGIPQNIGKLSSLKALYLARNRFNGSLPVPGLCELRRLQELDIHYNGFEGTLPPCLGNLTSLQYIDISNNDFEGSFSFSSIFNHSKLEVIVLGSRENKLQIDNDNQAGNPLFQLKKLLLSNCNMKNAPNFLLNQHRLREVNLSHNKLNGMFPSWLLENNTDLEFLDLNNNSFTGKFDHLPQHPMNSMVFIDVSKNHLDGHLSKDLGMILPNLKRLNLSMNNMEGELPPSIGGMKNLQILDLSFNNFTGEVPKELTENCTCLHSLLLNDNNFHGEIFSAHFKLSKIQVLRLGNNQFTGNLITNKEFYSGIMLLDISNNYMAGKIPSGIDAKVLLMRNNSFEGQIPREGFSGTVFVDISHNFLWGPLPSCFQIGIMEQIHLQGNNFTGSVPNALLNSSTLSVLNLRDNSLSGNIPTQIGALPNLRILLLGNNRLSGLIPRQLCQLREISIMDLSNNSLSGSVPSCLSNISFGTRNGLYYSFIVVRIYSRSRYNLECDDGAVTKNTENPTYTFSYDHNPWRFEDKNAVEIDFVTKNSLLPYQGDVLSYMSGLDLSCNNLSGEIPQSLGKLLSIRALNLSHNHLTGSIPVSLSNLTQVESLDFSYNSLSGKIPSELVSLTFLEVFSVAHNNLSGRIPDKGQFPTFGCSSYEGNPYLSGLPSEKNCTKVVEMPLPSDEIKEKWYEIDRTFFIASFIATYIVFLLGFGTVLYINSYWRKRWFYFLENLLYCSSYFVVDTLHKLAANFNN